jgi:hypothetical protein
MLQGYTVLDAVDLEESFLVFVQMIFAIDIALPCLIASDIE